jgi:hypothetical protein
MASSCERGSEAAGSVGVEPGVDTPGVPDGAGDGEGGVGLPGLPAFSGLFSLMTVRQAPSRERMNMP